MTTLTTDVRGLLRAVEAAPDDDTARLVLADALDESGDHDRAEMVRLQVELAVVKVCTGCKGSGKLDADHRPGTIQCRMCWGKGSPNCGHYHELRARETALIDTHPHWFPYCPTCKGVGWHLQRGAPDCDCHGGRLGTFRRGLLDTIPIQQLTDAMEGEGDNWRPTEWACTVFSDPFMRLVRTVIPVDREPTQNGGLGFGWFDESCHTLFPEDAAAFLPHVVFVKLPDSSCGEFDGRYYPTIPDATDALGTALCDVLRETAG